MKQPTKKTKIALGFAGAGILVLAVALGIWQPWKAPADPNEELGQVQDALMPSEEQENEEEKLVLTVGNEEIPCTIFAGDGWQIYVPEEWKVDAGANGGAFSAVDAGRKTLARVEVIRSIPAVYSGSYLSTSPQALSDGEIWRCRTFYVGGEEGGWEVTCQGPEETWDDYQRLMTAMARTMTVGEEMPFSGLFPVADEPDWQRADGSTLLWMDKDAYIVDEAVKEHVVAEMLAWDAEKKSLYTGQYGFDPVDWAASYTCLTDEGYVDIFSTAVCYKVADGMEANIAPAEGRHLADGWLFDGERVYVVLFHDGSSVSEVRILRSNDTVPGYSGFAAELMR